MEVQKIKENISYSNNNEISFLDVNGNKLVYIYGNDLSDLIKKSEETFKGNFEIDSIIGLIDLGNNRYRFYVIERDGSLSDFCGNGAIGALKIIRQKNKNANKIILINTSGIETSVEYDKGEYFVEMEVLDSKNISQITNNGFLNEKISFLEKLKKSINLEEVFDYYAKNLYDLNKLFPDNNNDLSNYDTYFAQLIINLQKDIYFKKLISSCKILDIGIASGEPHLVIEINSIKNEFLRDYYLKGLSFLIRNSWIDGENIFPQNVNIMFLEKNKESYKIYPAERGVYNGVNYDQTGACGTGTTIVGNYLLKNNGKDEVKIKNRSGIFLGIQKKNGKIFLVGNEENILTDFEINKKFSFFSGEALVERIFYAMNKGRQNFQFEKDFSSWRNNVLDSSGIEEFKIFKNERRCIENSCFHETEFPIDPYKIISLINQYFISHKLSLTPLVWYLDTQNSGKTNIYPNVQKNKNSKKLLSLLKEIIENSQSIEEFERKFKEIYKDIFSLIEQRLENLFFDGYLFEKIPNLSKDEKKPIKKIVKTFSINNLYKSVIKIFYYKLENIGNY